jgi:uncharacterized protein YgiM (DUF1202 family)
MKSNCWLFGGLVWLAAASVFAQNPARGTNPPAGLRGVTGPLAKDVVLDPPATATIRIDTLLVRSQPTFAGEVITSVKKGQEVTVLEQITLAKPKLNEPTNWARILLPTNAPVWVFADYVDTNTMTISRSRVNIRSGSSDFHDIVGRLEKGAPVKEVRRVPDWIQIEPPTNAYGFVGADYLTMQPPAAPPPAVVAVEPAVPAPAAAAPAAAEPVAAAPVASQPVAAAPVAPEPVAPPATNTTPEAANTTPAAAPATAEPVAAAPAAAEPVAAAPVTPEPVAPPATNTTPEATNTAPATAAAPAIVAPEPVATAPAPPPAPANPTPPAASAPAEAAPAAAAALESASIDVKPRTVTREGFVRKALNIQAPADYELHDLSSGRLIEYLQPDPKDKYFKAYTDTRVSVTGTEWLDRRWPKTPVLRVQTYELMP